MALKFFDAELQEDFDNIPEWRKFQMKKRFAFAEQLRLTLKEKGISQKEFSGMLDKSESEISKWLSGFHNFTKDTESLIEYCLGVDLSVLVKDIRPEIVYLFALSEQHQSNAVHVKIDDDLSELNITTTTTVSANSSSVFKHLVISN